MTEAGTLPAELTVAAVRLNASASRQTLRVCDVLLAALPIVVRLAPTLIVRLSFLLFMFCLSFPFVLFLFFCFGSPDQPVIRSARVNLAGNFLTTEIMEGRVSLRA